MDLEQIRKRKEETEKTLVEILDIFERDTGVKIKSMSLGKITHRFTEAKTRILNDVKIKLEDI